MAVAGYKSILIPHDRRWVDGSSEKRKNKNIKWDAKKYSSDTTDKRYSPHVPSPQHLCIPTYDEDCFTAEDKVAANTSKNSISPKPIARIQRDDKPTNYREARKSMSATRSLRPVSWGARSSTYTLKSKPGTLDDEDWSEDDEFSGDDDEETESESEEEDPFAYLAAENRTVPKPKSASRLSMSAPTALRMKKDAAKNSNDTNNEKTNPPEPKQTEPPKKVESPTPAKAPTTSQKLVVKSNQPEQKKISRLSLSATAQKRMREREAKKAASESSTSSSTKPAKPVPSAYDFSKYMKNNIVTKETKETKEPEVFIPPSSESPTERVLLKKAHEKRASLELPPQVASDACTGALPPRVTLRNPPYTFVCEYSDTKKVTVGDKLFTTLQSEIGKTFGTDGLSLFFQEEDRKEVLNPLVNQETFELALSCPVLPKIIVVDSLF